MKSFVRLVFLLLAALPAFAGPDHPTLAIGTQAPDFSLPGVDGKNYSLADFSAADVLVVVFTCNHCPTAQAYEDRLIRLTADYKPRNVAVVAIMPNDPKSITPNELNYTDIGDSFDEMKYRAAQKHFNFPYLYDGDEEKAAKAYGPAATPHVFIFDRQRKLRYSGRIDDVENPRKTPRVSDTRNAIDELLAGKPVSVPKTKVFGCSTKWAEKSSWIDKAREEWAAEPVAVDTIGEAGLRELLRNEHSGKLRLINVWATWCGPCTAEFSELVMTNRMYRSRDFEMVTISADAPEKKDKVLEFLKKQQASSNNYLYAGDDRYKMIEAIDSDWQGALPYTIVVEPGGKKVYAKEGIIDPRELRKAIVEDPLIGRYYP